MAEYQFITIRLGKDSVSDINLLCSSPIGIQEQPFDITVKCTQIPDDYDVNTYAFIWLGSDNNKGAKTKWGQGFKAMGIVKNVKRAGKYNDTSETVIQVVYILRESINKIDFLRDNPTAYYWCSSMPLIGIDDHANQTIRSIGKDGLSSLRALFSAIQSSAGYFMSDIIKIQPGFSQYFANFFPSPKKYRKTLSLGEVPADVFGISEGDKKHCHLLSALRTKPFMLLAGISGTGKSRNVRKLAQATVTEKLQREYDPEYKGGNFEEDRWKLHKPANFEIIQVKPNWHNSMDVVGYLSNIPEPHYVFTPFVHFIVKAWQNPDVPFFLCLDEMNLAPVEEYFAEYLSAIESRSFENGEYETDPIIKPFKEFGEEKPSKDSKEPDKKSVCGCMLDALLPDFTASDTNGEKAKLIDRLRNKGLTLPQNLIVIGTVNMDETTFSFSRKVLDRAMSIEMNEVDYEKFILGATDDEIKNLCSQIGTKELNHLLVDRHIEANEVLTELGGTMEGSDTLFVINYLERINELLEGTPFKLGYRASNEALIYLAAAKDFGCQSNSAAMDGFTLMKILSRIEGDESKLKLTNSAFDQERLDAAGVNKDEAEKHGGLTLLTALREIIKNHLGEYQQTDAEEEEPQAETETQDSDAADDANEEVQAAKPALLRSIRKIDSMISQLERDHFVSYWN